MSALIFSDLDGTLLDHDTYDTSPALPALQQAREQGHPVILNTSKTAPETLRWHHALHLDGAYIVENGAAIHAADGTLQTALGVERATLLEHLHKIRKDSGLEFCGFSDASIEQIVDWTGLSHENAERASQRSWSEPLKWLDRPEAIDDFRQALEDCGLQLLRGGRFWHVQGHHNKANALRQLQASEQAEVTVALGDGENDVAMIQAANIGVLVRSPAHAFPELASPPARLLHTQQCGPAGWAEAMNIIFKEGWLRHE